ncbi:hypothetical protein C8F04DRAFT_1387742 [Mycena alexandri]|uniref:F-box domain-containing protein n=1 Tax=Mycena alexandri TaxID=1745969 RepID=A0AAD6TKW1_9AGAR|nr:hypothetical protein C8F04DRAFT_1387742 [Mycena alexandri]
MRLLPTRGQRRKSAVKGAVKGAITFPLELQFLVLDQLSDDDLELRRLCTTCKAWANHIQRIIFRHIWVTSATTPRLVRLFLNKPHLGKYVQVVTVVESASFASIELLFVWLSDVLPNLQTLDILRCSFGADIFPLQQSVLVKITYLRLRSAQFTSGETLLQFIGLFPRLEGLDLSGHCAAYGRALTPPTSSLQPPRRLRYLACNATFHGVLMKWLARGPVIVDELYITGRGGNNGELEDFLLKVGDGVKHLRLTAPPWPSPQLDAIVIPPFPSLHSLEVDLHLLNPAVFYWDTTLPAIDLEGGFLYLLKQLLSPALSTMYFDTFVAPAHLDLPWDKLDAILTRFSSLEEVIFDLYGHINLTGGTKCGHVDLPTYADLCRGMRKAMPRSDARGILKFRCAGKGPPPQSRLLRDVFC